MFLFMSVKLFESAERILKKHLPEHRILFYWNFNVNNKLNQNFSYEWKAFKLFKTQVDQIFYQKLYKNWDIFYYPPFGT